jgi:hypothetical protein
MEIKWYKFKESFEKFIIRDLEKALKANIEVGTIILTVIGIESLSGYFVGEKSNGKTFKKFIDTFMPAYSNHAESLYKCIRNGLAHDYIIKEYEGKSFLLTRDSGGKHLEPVYGNNGWFYLNREQFALDFLKAQKEFFLAVEKDVQIQERALRHLNKNGFLDVFSSHSEINFDYPSDETDECHSVTGTSQY